MRVGSWDVRKLFTQERQGLSMAKLFPLTHWCVTKLKLLILLGLADSVCLQRQYQNTHKGSAMVNVWYKRKSWLYNWICLFHPFLLLCQEPTLLRVCYRCCALICPQSPFYIGGILYMFTLMPLLILFYHYLLFVSLETKTHHVAQSGCDSFNVRRTHHGFRRDGTAPSPHGA